MKTPEFANIYADVAAINVDIQNDFALPTGSLSVIGGDEIITPVNQLNAWVRHNDGTVVFTQDWHPRGTAHFAENGGLWPVHCVQETDGAGLHKGLDIQPSDVIAHKGMSMVDDGYSGLEAVDTTGRSIEQLIRDLEYRAAQQNKRLALLFEGLATDFCDKASVLGALAVTDRSITDIFLMIDAIRAVDLQPGDGERAIEAMTEAGALAMTTQQIIQGGIVIDHSRLER